MRFTFYAIGPIARGAHRGGADEEDFDPDVLPFDLGNGVFVEDVSPFIPDDEFEIYEKGMGSHTYEHLERLRYALVHRFPEYRFDDNNHLVKETELMFESRRLVAETAACFRLIRPTTQHLHQFEGQIRDDGMFSRIGLDTPRDSVSVPINQRNFSVRTMDLLALRKLAPVFHNAMAGEFWKFRMSIQMHEPGFFLNENWKAQYFLWTAALEALYTTQANQGGLVATERIKSLLGPSASIYPAGELVWIYPDPNLTVTDVIGEIYCLRNHIAHGDKVPDYYFTTEGRPTGYGGSMIPRHDMYERRCKTRPQSAA
jgi:hypothetical protein